MKEKTRKVFNINLSEAREFLAELVPQAGEILRRHFFSGDFIQKSRGGVDFTTQADEEVDAFLREHIVRKYPQSQFLTEETAPSDYSTFVDRDNLWVIDPVDGTTNFSRKRPHFGVSVALVNKGIPRLGVVYLPMQDELYLATKNSKTLLNGKEIHVSETNKLQRVWVESGISWDMERRKDFAGKWIPKIVKNVRAFTMSGSTVFDMAAVAKGQVDAFVYCGIKPWDQAATGLLIQKAGGIITTVNGKPWNIFEKDIVASNGAIHAQLLSLISTRH